MTNPLLRMPIRRRLATILVAFLIPIIMLGWELNVKLSESIDFSEQELRGVRYEEPLISLLNDISDYQVTVLAKAAGVDLGTSASESAAKVEANIATLKAVDKELAEQLDMTPEGLKKHGETEALTVDNLEKKWQAIKTAPAYSADAYKALFDDVAAMIKHIGDSSNLILDGDLDTYYLMDAGIVASPTTLTYIASLKARIFTLLHNNGGILPDSTDAIIYEDASIIRSSHLTHMNDSVTTSFKEDGNFNGINETLKPSLEPKLAQFQSSGNTLVTTLESLAKNSEMSAAKFNEISNKFQDDATALTEATMVELEKMMKVRVDELHAYRLKTMLFSGAVVVFAFLLFWLVSNSISRPIGNLQQTISRIAEGDTDMAIPTDDSKNEINMLYAAAAKLRNTVEDAFRLKLMVEDMPTGLMTVDTRNELKVNFVNKSLRKILSGIQLSVPGDRVVGQPVDTLHSSLGGFKSLFARANNMPHLDQLKIGDEILSLQSAPIMNKKGEYVGAMLAWDVITARAKLADNFESTVKSVVTEVATSAVQMRGSAERLNTLADETKQSSVIVAAASTEAAQTANQVAAAAEELTASIAEISSQVQKSSAVASQASEQAENINQSMHMLVEKSNRVGEVIQFITNIASQINLLALNATIESARAGEAGKGFAVVASEVKNLANQTAKATEEIVQQVQSMQDATNQAVESVGQIITIIGEISASTAGVAAAVEEQSAATNEISRNITHTASGTAEISQNIQRVEQGAEETGGSARQVLDSAATLNEHAATLAAKVDEFLQMVRST